MFFFSSVFPNKAYYHTRSIKTKFSPHQVVLSAWCQLTLALAAETLSGTISEPHGKWALGYFLNANIVLDKTSETKCGWAGCSIKPQKCKDWGSIALARDHSRTQITAPPPNKAPGLKQNKTPNQEIKPQTKKQNNKTTLTETFETHHLLLSTDIFWEIHGSNHGLEH